MNGLEVIAKMRTIHPKTTIVVLTGIPCEDALREKLKKLEVTQIFSKPKGIQELLLYVKKLAAKHSAA
jgi:hypothetical protein